MNLSTTAKTNLRNQAKELGLRTVAVSYDQLIADIMEKTEQSLETTLFLAEGGQITKVPGFEGVAPKKVNRNETSAGGKVEPKRQPRRVPRTDPDVKVTKVKEGLVTIQNICDELDVEGRIARRKLRTSGIDKPGKSWEWEAGHADIQKVKELLKK